MCDNLLMTRRTAILRLTIAFTPWALFFVPVMGYRLYTQHRGREELEAVVARIEATDPRWRWEDIDADRPPVADNQNAALWVAAFNRDVRNGTSFIPYRPDNQPVTAAPESPNRLLDDEGYRLIAATLAKHDAAGRIIEQLSRCPDGRPDLARGRSRAEARIASGQWAGDLMRYLECQSEGLVGSNDFGAQVAVIVTLLNVTGMYRGLPSRDGQEGWSFRNTVLAARRLERALATSASPTNLNDLQTTFGRVADADLYRPAIRGLRASYDMLFRELASGEADLGYYLHGIPGAASGIRERVATWTYRAHLPADWAAVLDFTTWALQLADYPEATRLAVWIAGPRPPKAGAHLASGYGCPNEVEVLLKSQLLVRALFRCAVAGVAVERHRQITGDWPETLSAIPQAILPAVPLDPCTGEPLRLVRRPDGVTVYSVGPDGTDDGGNGPTIQYGGL